MNGMSQGARDGGATMSWMNGQIFAPAISAFPPSVVVVCRKEQGRRCDDVMNKRIIE
jgi:hypothetical protein